VYSASDGTTDKETNINNIGGYGNCQEQLRTFEVVDFECPWCWPIMETLEAGNSGRNASKGSHSSYPFSATERTADYGKIFKTDGWSVWMEASCTGVYSDPGARCYDHTDGIMDGLSISNLSRPVREELPSFCPDGDFDPLAQVASGDFDPHARGGLCDTRGDYLIEYTSETNDAAHALNTHDLNTNNSYPTYTNTTDLGNQTHKLLRQTKKCLAHSKVKSFLMDDGESSYSESYSITDGEETYLEAKRYVYIRDYTQPVIDMNANGIDSYTPTNGGDPCTNGNTCLVEAGYEYRDPKPKGYDDLCNDELCCCQLMADGYQTGTDNREITAAGDAHVMMAAQYQSFHSCQDIYKATESLNTNKQLIAPFRIGEHDITLAGENGDGATGGVDDKLRKAWCDNTTANGDFVTWIIPHDNSSCPAGTNETTSGDTYYDSLTSSRLYRLKDRADQGKRLCKVIETHDTARVNRTHPVDVSHAFAGEYELKYNIRDCAGNPAVTKYRTITVTDTLPPVIQLKLFNELIQQSSYKSYTNTSSGQNIGVNSTPGHEFELQTLGQGADWMEESPVSSTNGWIVGAIAAAATGLALVAYSRFTSTQTIEV